MLNVYFTLSDVARLAGQTDNRIYNEIQGTLFFRWGLVLMETFEIDIHLTRS